MKTRTLSMIVTSVVLAFAVSLHAGVVVPTSYSYNTASNHGGNFADSGNELNDDDLATGSWPNPTPDEAKFVGWSNLDPDITFNFAGVTHVTKVTLHLADADGAAGVNLPSGVTLSGDGGFSESFAIVNPAGGGVVRDIMFDLTPFSVMTDDLRVAIDNVSEWTMLTEVDFEAAMVPAPAAMPAGLAMLGLVATRRRRK